MEVCTLLKAIRVCLVLHISVHKNKLTRKSVWKCQKSELVFYFLVFITKAGINVSFICLSGNEGCGGCCWIWSLLTRFIQPLMFLVPGWKWQLIVGQKVFLLTSLWLWTLCSHRGSCSLFTRSLNEWKMSHSLVEQSRQVINYQTEEYNSKVTRFRINQTNRALNA